MCFDDGLGLKSIIYGVFMICPIILKVFINIHEYANYVICISGHGMTAMCQAFKLVLSSVV